MFNKTRYSNLEKNTAKNIVGTFELIESNDLEMMKVSKRNCFLFSTLNSYLKAKLFQS